MNKGQQFWLGKPCKFTDHPSLEGLPEDSGDGGRLQNLPSDITPQQFFDMTMPGVMAIQAQMQQQAAMSGGKMPAYGFLAQGIQVTWIFTSMEIGELKTQLFKANQKIEALEKRLDALEPKPS